MELNCPKCNKLQFFSDDEIFPNCKCGYMFETFPILDKALPISTTRLSPKIENNKMRHFENLIITTSSSMTISKYLGIIAVDSVLNEAAVIEEFSGGTSPKPNGHYQCAINNLLSKLKSHAFSLGANGVIGINFQHCVLTSSLGGPGILIFAQGTAVIL